MIINVLIHRINIQMQQDKNSTLFSQSTFLILSQDFPLPQGKPKRTQKKSPLNFKKIF